MLRIVLLVAGVWGSAIAFAQVRPAFRQAQFPVQTEITPTSFTLSWQTSEEMPTCVRYGRTPDLEHECCLDNRTTGHTITLEGLEPATFYYAEAVGGAKGTAPRLYATGSKSTGQIEVFFNQFTEPGVANGSFPAGSSYLEVESAIFSKIDQAKATIDVAMYNANWVPFVNVLKNAYDRGVIVRYICDDQTNNFALNPLPDFPVVAGNPGDPLMHNKFLVIDADSEEDAYVICGAMNFTDNNLQDDYNNVVIIQDQALAKAFEIEFEEMWGSSGPSPNPALARFGSEKLDNTPHLFNIGGVAVECYFAPSDGVTDVMVEKVNAAEEHLDFALMLLTSDPLSNALNQAHLRGVALRGIADGDDQPSSDIGFLDLQGINVQVDGSAPIFHHKYAIIDHQGAGSDPTVITGSFNWTFSAETINDESTLIFHSAEIANWFWQEFEARWGTLTDVTDRRRQPAGAITLSPNPAYTETQVTWMGSAVPEEVLLEVYSLTGKRLFSERWNASREGASKTLNTSGWPDGLYLLRVRTTEGEQTLKFAVQGAGR